MGIKKGTKLGPRKNKFTGEELDDVPWVIEGERVSGGTVTTFKACVTAASAGYAKDILVRRSIRVTDHELETTVKFTSTRRRFT